MPGASFILGLLRRQLDVRQLDNHLESSLGIFLAEAYLIVKRVRDKFSWFWPFDGLTPLPFPVFLAEFVVILFILVRRLRLGFWMVLILNFIVFNAFIIIFQETQGCVPHRDGLRQNPFDDLVQASVSLGM
jgi:hypothetical protein